MDSELDRLPTKLCAAVKEYLRQRESGALQGHWTISLQLAKLLRGAYLTADDTVMSATKGALCGMDPESEMLVCSIADRMTTTSGTDSVNATVEEVRVAPTELKEEILGYDASRIKRTMVIDGDHHALLDEGVQVFTRNALPNVTSALEKGDIVRCVIISTGIHCAQGVAICPGGSRVFARAARRLRIPVILAAARFSFVHGDGTAGNLPKRKRAHPGVPVGDNDTDIVRYKNDHLPIEEASVVMTEQGGYHPKYVKAMSSTD